MPSTVAIAAGTDHAADAAADIVRAGGNAVDAALCATFVSWVVEPGLTSLGGGGYFMVRAPGQSPVAIDAFVEMPGRAAPRERFGTATRVHIPYGGGVDTIIGPGSIATPGSLAGAEAVWHRFGRMKWDRLLAPAIDFAREGYRISRPSALYFEFGAQDVLSLTPDAANLARDANGVRLKAGDVSSNAALAQTLERIARGGADVFYKGELGRRIAHWVVDHGGLLGPADLAAYRPIERTPLTVRTAGWRFALNPPPAAGGVVVAMILRAYERELAPASRSAASNAQRVRALTIAMQQAFEARPKLLAAEDVEALAHTLLTDDSAARGGNCSTAAGAKSSPATSHTSVVDSDGLACAITTSTGYSAGVVVPGTGILLNNMLGEMELNPRGLHAHTPGARLRSNMCPTIAQNDRGEVLAIGAAGAERIASALARVLTQVVFENGSLVEAVGAARWHVEDRQGIATLAVEPGVDTSAVDLPLRPFEGPHMFFGGVQAARRGANGSLEAAGDPRRDGASRLV